MTRGFRPAIDAALLLVLAVTLRLTPVRDAVPGGLMGDEIVYHEQARALIAGHGYVDTGEWSPAGAHQPTAYRTPGVAAILAVVYSIAGEDVAVGRFTVVAIASLCAPLIYLLVLRLFESRTAALVAGASFALMLAPRLLSARLLNEAPAATLVTAATYFALSPRRRAAACAGLAAGTAVLFRAYLQPWLIALPAFHWLRGRRDLAAVTLAAALVVPVAWAARNSTTIGVFTVSTQTLSLWQGASPFTDGRWPGAWTPDHPQYGYFVSRVPEFESLDEAGRGRAFSEQARRELIAHPQRNVSLVPAKLWWWADPQTPSGELDLVWLLVAVLAIGGVIAIALTRQWAEGLLLTAPIAASAFAAVATFGDPRFRHPSDPLLCVLAGAASAWPWRAQLLWEATIVPAWVPRAMSIRARARRYRDRYLARGRDPIVWYRRLRIYVPLSHPLGIFECDAPLYNRPLAVMASILAARYPDLSIVDVGANVGDTAAATRLETDVPMLCIEGEPDSFALLARNHERHPAITCVEAVASEHDGVIAARWRHYQGNAVLEQDPHAPPIAIRSLDSIIAGHPRFAGSRLLKVDVEGRDLAVLRGARALIRANRPALLFEYNMALHQHAAVELTTALDEWATQSYRMAQVFRTNGAFETSFDLAGRAARQGLVDACQRLRVCDVAVWAERDADLAPQLALACRLAGADG